jgi:NlpC/P60 family putative phage cell wall peptidase
MSGNLPPVTRAQIVCAAQDWIGTPYQHQASLIGVGCDCLGLVGGVWAQIYGAWPEAAPPYRSDWAELGTDEPLLSAARRHLVAMPLAAAVLPGDLLLFRMSPQAQIKHCALVTAARTPRAEARIIHAYWGHAVVESWLGPWWRRRLAARFAFPTVRD